jgi:hypothetical protein
MKCFIHPAFLGKAAYAAAGIAPTSRTSTSGCKLGAMDTAFGRFAFQMLVLLACAIATWGGPDPTPTREVVELVSVVYKPARIEASAAVEPVNAQATVSSPETNAEQLVLPKQAQGQPPVVVQQAKVAPPEEPAPARSTRKSVAASEAKVSCRPPACREAEPGKQAVTKRTDTRQARKAEPPRPTEPPLPAVFVPVRRLGLYLQARLGVESQGTAAPGNGTR